MRESSHDPPEACHPTPPRVPLPPGATIGGAYRVTALPGTGAMGEVYRARDTRLGRDVAVKLLPPSAKAEGGRELGALSEEVSLGTHIRDVVTLLERETSTMSCSSATATGG